MKLSIITGYYKTYELTEKLAEVLIPQITSEVEWLIIDDGCNETRLDKYNDKINIFVTHLKENKGAAYTYNLGIEKAKGKYISFIDCDDLVSNDYVSTLISTISKHNEDLLFINWKDMNTGIEFIHPTNIAAFKCVYKKDIIPRFPNIKGEFDIPFHNEIMKNKYTRCYIDKILYYYNSNRIDSITYNLQKERSNNNAVEK